MTHDELIKDENTSYGTCRGCGHDLVPSTQGQEDIPEDEILLECSILGTGECVISECFPVDEFTE
jgi:hypothetical protein